MVWEPKIKLVSVEPFINNLKTIFEEDYVDALAWASPGEALPGLAAINTARQANKNWPVLNLIPYGNDPDESQDGARVNEQQRILCEWETVSRVANSLAVHLVRYVLAGRSVLYEMSRERLTAGIESGRIAGVTRSISNERYGERFWESENRWTMVGSVVLTINYFEGKSNG